MQTHIFADSEKLSPWWRYAVVFILIFGFSILGFITKLAYENAPPIPERVVGPDSQTLFTGEDILNGQAVFLKYNLMEHGTLWGHGAYLGPDYTASYLHQEALDFEESLAKAQYGSPYAALTDDQKGLIREKIPAIIKENRFDNISGTLAFTEEQKNAFENALLYWKDYFTKGSAPGLPKNYIANEKELADLTAFFSWASWAASTNREGEAFTYTNNFPFEPLIDNYPSADAYFWSAMSLIFLLAGIGAILFAFGKFNFLGWHGNGEKRHIHETHLTAHPLLPSQTATIPFFIVVALLFLLQSLCGGLVAHYRVENEFYGFPLADYLPYNLLRTWHLQLAIFWIATAWVGSGLFIAPLFSNQEPRYQKTAIHLLLGAIVLVALGSLFGELLSAHNLLGGELWFWFGNQGSEYLDLGRFWQFLLIAGLFFWLFLLFRALKPAFKNEHTKELSLLFFMSASAIPIFYVPAIFYDQHTNFTIIDNWRFWIIHLWVEGFFEVFATVIVAVIFVLMGVTKPVTAKRVIYLDIILYLGSGVVGTGHHWYFTGQTNINMALSACFSAMEIVPLTLLTLDAWDFINISNRKCDQCGHYLAARQKWTIFFFISVGVWNFIGAGIFGFIINLPVISYFEIGTNLTPNHGHAAMFGVFGMLSLGTTIFCIRAFQTEEIWNRTKKLIIAGFYGVNIGMALMVMIDLFPSGILQLWDSMTNGYWHARDLNFIMTGTFHRLGSLRIIADTLFLVAGVIPLFLAIMLTYYYGVLKKGPAKA